MGNDFMAIPAEYKERFVYQFTHIENLPSILKHGLLSCNEKDRLGIQHVSIAEESIQQRRARMRVTCRPGGVVHDYVPFYFCSRSSMLLRVVNAKNVDQLYLIYTAIPIDVLEQADVVFTDASANTAEPPAFYSDPSDLSKLDWECIDSKKWSLSSDVKNQARMAECLIHKRLGVDEIDHIVVWNKPVKRAVESIYSEAGLSPPEIVFDGQKGKHHYYTNFYEGGTVSIVTGPTCLYGEYKNTLEEIRDSRAKSAPKSPEFVNTEDAVEKIGASFCCLPELAAIDTLETNNKEHHEAVGAHTRRVVEKLQGVESYKGMPRREKTILLLAAYLHDIGKGASPRDNNDKQKVDPDHPARTLKMLRRILSEEFRHLLAKDIRQIIMLVCYHDLIGDVLSKGRNKKQIVGAVKTLTDFDMLAALTIADVSSLIPDRSIRLLSAPTKWLRQIKSGLAGLRKWVSEQLKE
ncbi:hypothetical protein ES703_09322 [subsurface metagenome]